MTNIHKLKDKKKNINRTLAKLYKQKHTTTEAIRQLEEARTNITVSIQSKREDKIKRVK